MLVSAGKMQFFVCFPDGTLHLFQTIFMERTFCTPNTTATTTDSRKTQTLNCSTEQFGPKMLDFCTNNYRKHLMSHMEAVCQQVSKQGRLVRS